MSGAGRFAAARWMAGIVCLLCVGPACGQTLNCATDLWPGENMADLGAWGPSYTGGAPCIEDASHKSSLRSEFGVDVRIFVPKNWSRSWHPEVPRDVVSWIADAVRSAMRKLRPALAPMDINIILLESPFQAGSDWMTDTYAHALMRNPCPISLSIISMVERREGSTVGSVPQRDLQAFVAHEVMHCYQTTHFPDQFRNVKSTSRAWWVESTAEYIAQDLYPCNRLTLNHAGGYQPGQPVFRQSYANFVFFQHLEDRYGFDVRKLAAFLGAMPDEPLDEAQRRALAGWSGISDQWHSFARAVQDAQFSDCIAANLNSVALVTQVGSSQDISISSIPFTTEAHGVQFTRNARYKVRVRDDSGTRRSGSQGRDRVSYRVGTVWKWADVNGDPFTVETGCEEDKTYMFVVTSTREDEQPYKIIIEVERTPQNLPNCCVDTGQHDHCVVGTWVLDNDEMLRHLSQINPKVAWDPPQGELRTRFEADGRIQGAQANLLFKGKIILNVGGTAPFSVSIAGQGEGRWSTESASGGRLLHTCPTRNQSTVDTKINWPDLPAESRKYAPATPVPGLSRYYVCSGNSLTVLQPGNRMKQIYRRATP